MIGGHLFRVCFMTMSQVRPLILLRQVKCMERFHSSVSTAFAKVRWNIWLKVPSLFMMISCKKSSVPMQTTRWKTSLWPSNANKTGLSVTKIRPYSSYRESPAREKRLLPYTVLLTCSIHKKEKFHPKTFWSSHLIKYLPITYPMSFRNLVKRLYRKPAWNRFSPPSLTTNISFRISSDKSRNYWKSRLRILSNGYNTKLLSNLFPDSTNSSSIWKITISERLM